MVYPFDNSNCRDWEPYIAEPGSYTRRVAGPFARIISDIVIDLLQERSKVSIPFNSLMMGIQFLF